MAYQVFICHSSHDKPVADSACAALEADGIECWIAPRDVPAGVEWGKSIIDALTSCPVVVLIFSGLANESPQVRREIERAVSKGKIILPFRIEDVQPSDAMEYALGSTHWLDAFAPPVEHRLEELCQSVSRLLNRKRAVAVKPPAPVEVPAVVEPVAPPPPAPSPLPVPAGGKGWRWIAVVAVLAVLVVLGFVLLRPQRVVVVKDGTKTASKPDVFAMESEAERFYLEKNYVAAFPLAKDACDGGGATGCNYEAAMYLMGAGTAKDEVQAVALYRKACEGGKAAGCSNLGAMYARGQGIAQDDTQALAYYRKSCDAAYPIGCTATGDFYEKGRGVAADPAQAAAFYQKGCDEGNMLGCSNLAALYFDGRGVAQDQDAAMKLYRKACDGRNQPACEFLKAHGS